MVTILRKRKQLRLKDYDYTQEGAYFVTICTQDRKIHFEENSSLMNIVRTQWVELPEAFSNIYLDEFTIMLEHIHGIIFIERRGLIYQTPNRSKGEINQGVMNHAFMSKWGLMCNSNVTLGKIIRHFKAKCTKLIRNQGYTAFQWQRGYYDRVIRNDIDLNKIKQYITDNTINLQV